MHDLRALCVQPDCFTYKYRGRVILSGDQWPHISFGTIQGTIQQIFNRVMAIKKDKPVSQGILLTGQPGVGMFSHFNFQKLMPLPS